MYSTRGSVAARKDFGEGTNLEACIILASFWRERMTYAPAHESIEPLPLFLGINILWFRPSALELCITAMYDWTGVESPNFFGFKKLS